MHKIYCNLLNFAIKFVIIKPIYKIVVAEGQDVPPIKKNVKEYMSMKRTKMKMNNKGFTLVELIVVLVILAILAAILVPTLMGYIDKARSEKDFSTAQAVRVAVQSVIAEKYGKSGADVTALTAEEINSALALIGAKDGKVDGQSVSVSKDNVTIENNQLTKIVVTINDSNYTYDSSKNTWEAAKKQTQ